MKAGILFILCIIGFNTFTYANHLIGGQITYECTSTPDQYKLRLTIFRECTGPIMGSTVNLDLNSLGCNQSTSATLYLLPNSGNDVTITCPQFPATNCPGSPAGTVMVPVSVQEYIYEGTVTLSNNLDNCIWTISYNNCCRLAPNLPFVISSTLNDSIITCNNSPQFPFRPQFYSCANKSLSINPGVYDPDGDSLSFELLDSKTYEGTFFNYPTGLSGIQPLYTIGNVIIDPQSGQITMTPNGTQNGIICIKVNEYRNGIKIGEYLRDYYIVITNCNNPAPTLSGINGTNKIKYKICPGQPVNFSITAADPNPFQIVDLTWNYAIPGAAFTTTGPGQSITGTFSWTPPPGSKGSYIFALSAKDDGCPVPAEVQRGFVIELNDPAVNLGADQNICAGDSAAVNIFTSVDFDSYQWLPDPFGGMFDDTIAYFTPTVTTSYILNASNNTCSASDTVTIFVSSPVQPAIIQDGDTLFSSIVASSYAWYLNDTLIAGATGPSLVITENGNYTLIVTDANGCEATSNIYSANIGIREQTKLDRLIKIYPNPADEKLNISLPELPGGIVVKIYSTDGKNIYTATYVQELLEVDVKHWPAGIYFIDVMNEGQTVRRQFVKQ